MDDAPRSSQPSDAPAGSESRRPGRRRRRPTPSQVSRPEESRREGDVTAQEATAADEVSERLAEAHRNYVRALREAWRPEEAQKRVETAYLDYVRALVDAQSSHDVFKSAEAHLNYLRALRDAWLPPESQQHFEEAYRAYLRAVQEVWGQVDANSLNPSTLAAMGQSVLEVACYSRKTLSGGTRGGG